MTEYAFTVEPQALKVSGYSHTLFGAKDHQITDITVNGVSGVVSFPERTLWRFDTILSEGTNTFVLQGIDTATNLTAEETVTLVLPAFLPEVYPYFNVIDDHSVGIGLARNPGEKNWDFRTRLLQYEKAPTSSTLEGLFWASAIELGIKPVVEGMGLRVARDTNGIIGDTNVCAQVGPVYVYVDSDNLIHTWEAHRVEPRSRSIELDDLPRYTHDVEIYDQNDQRVDQHRFSISSKVVTFVDDDLNGQWTTARYNYRAAIALEGITLTALKTKLEAVQVGGASILEVSVEDGALPAMGLMRCGRGLLNRTWAYLACARCRVAPLDNPTFQASLLNSFGTSIGTKLERYARIARAGSNIGWDNLILDEGLWDSEAEVRALDFLPRLFDAAIGRWFCKHPMCTEVYDLDRAKKFGRHCWCHCEALEYQGMSRELLTSGVIGQDSLLTSVVETAEEI